MEDGDGEDDEEGEMTSEKMVQDKEDAALMVEAKKIAREKGWLVASALFYMFAHTPKSAGEERLDRINELQRRQSRYFTTEKRLERYKREHDSMPLPDWIVRDEPVEELERYK
jgi:hypothetical protein